MCRETFLIYPRCGHPKSSMGTIYHCPAYVYNGRTCVNNHGQTYKDYEFHIEDTRTQRFLDGRDCALPGGWKAEIAKGYKGYCGNCVEGRSEPMRKGQKEDFLDGYLGEHARWERERENRKKLAVEQERLMEKFRREKGESEAWNELD
jgi:hypothetical protein